jgi:6-phosphogluconolactonase
MKVFFWSLIMTLAVAGTATAQTTRQVRVYIGTYTQPGKSEGIYLFELNPATGKLDAKGLAGAVGNPSFIAVHPGGKFLYAVSETGNFQGKKQGAVSAFAISEDGKLTMINQQGSGGSGPCHISIDPTGRAALVAHYGSAHITSLPIKPDGSLDELASSFQHKGSSVNPGRQKEAHAHSTFIFPTQPTLALACDLGMDKVMLYTLDPASAKLTPFKPEFMTVPPGSGPRHLAFHPNRPVFYVINEMGNTVTTVLFEKQEFFTLQAGVPTLPEADKDVKNTTAEVVVHPSGKFLYGSNRGHDSIAIFKIDDAGQITPAGHVPSGGKSPRNFNIDPTGHWLIAANQNSDSLVVFKIDLQTGQLTQIDQAQCWAPVCVKFVP